MAVHVPLSAEAQAEARFLMLAAGNLLKPSDGIEGVKKFVVDTVKAAGSSPCPPMVVGVGIGGTLELAGLCAKRAAMRIVDGVSAGSA